MPTVGSRATAASPPVRAVRRLSAEDLSILALESGIVAGHTCKVIVLDSAIDLDRLRALIASRLDRVPELSLRLGEIDGALHWVVDPGVDVRAHVVACDVSAPPARASLEDAVARVFEQRLDRSRPMWRVDVIPALAGGGGALIWRIHHALADGMTAMRMIGSALWDTEPDAGAHAGGARRRSRAAARGDDGAHHHLEGLRVVVREAPHLWHGSPFNGHIGARRSVAFATVELEGLRSVATAVDGATINDAVLSVVAGALRRWLEGHHGSLGSVRVKVPVSLHASAATSGLEGAAGNRDSYFFLDLPLGSSDPLRRLASIRGATRVRKECHDAQELDALMHRLGHVPCLRTFAERVLAHPRSFAVNVSNVPGPRHSVSVLGAPVRALYSVAEIREHHALRIAVVSLADTLNFGLAADPTLLEDVGQLAGHIEAEATALTATLRAG